MILIQNCQFQQGIQRNLLQEEQLFQQEKYKDLLDEDYQLISEQLLEEYLFDIPNNIVFFTTKDSSKELEIFKEVAKKIKKTNKNLIFSYVIENQQSVSFQKLNIRSDFQLIYFYKGQKKKFNNKFTQDLLIDFILKIIDRSFTYLKSRQDFVEFEKKYYYSTRVIAVYDKDMIKQLKVLEKMINNNILSDAGNFALAYTFDQSIIPYPNDTECPSLILYKDVLSQDAKNTVIYQGNFNSIQHILDFLITQSLDTVNIYREEIAYRLFAGPVRQQMILILEKNNPDNQKHIQEFQRAAAINREKSTNYQERLLFFILYFDYDHYDLISTFGVYDTTNLPRIMINRINQQEGSVDKYLYDKDEIDSDFMIDFIGQFQRKELHLYYKSEEVDDDDFQHPQLHPVKKVVGKNHEDKIKNNKQTVVILYCSFDLVFARICGPSIFIYKYYVNKLYQLEKDDDIQFYFFDMFKNDLQKSDVQHVPTIAVFKRGYKKKPDLYRDIYNIQELNKFFSKVLPQLKIDITQKDIDTINYNLLPEEDKAIFTQVRQEDSQKKMQREMKEQQTKPRTKEEEEDFKKNHKEEYLKYNQRFQEENLKKTQQEYQEYLNQQKYKDDL